jgi:hypothetical protein
MAPADDGPKIHIDSDWKAEAEREKERLAEETATAQDRAALGEVSFVHLINMLAMQAAIALGGMRAPSGEAIPPDPELARFHIDMLGLLEQKTAGNLSEDEKKMLTGVLHELRASYVHLMDALLKHAAGQQAAKP